MNGRHKGSFTGIEQKPPTGKMGWRNNSEDFQATAEQVLAKYLGAT